MVRTILARMGDDVNIENILFFYNMVTNDEEEEEEEEDGQG